MGFWSFSVFIFISCLIAFWYGNTKAIRVNSGLNGRKLPSLPKYYGHYAVVWLLIPAFIGLSSKDLSITSVKSAVHKNVKNCFEVAQKKQEFGGSKLNIAYLDCNKNIVDNNSTNGIYINNEIKSDCVLKSGDKIQIGKYLLLLTKVNK